MGEVPLGKDKGAKNAHAAPKPASARETTSASLDQNVEAVLRVQGEQIKPSDIWRFNMDELREKAASLPAEQFRAFLQVRSAQLITDAVSESLLYQQAAGRLPEEAQGSLDTMVGAQIRKIVTANHEGVERKYEKHLAEQGLTLEDVRQRIRRELIVTSFLEEQLKPQVAEPTREQLLVAFRENADVFRKAPRRALALIDVRISEFLPKGESEPTREQSEEARRKAREQIEQAQSELRSGKSFAEVANKYSHGSQEGGSWGFIARDSVRERFLPALDALDRLQFKQVSEIIATPDGFFLVQCEQYEPGYDPDFETIQPRLVETVYRMEFQRLVGLRIEQLRKQADIQQADWERFHGQVVNAALKAAVARG
jgi:parvulin-like peptidyl-prolyl isomerase